MQGGDHCGEVCTGGLDVEAAQTVVAAKLQDDHGGVEGGDVGDAVDAILGGVAGNAFVDDAVGEAVAIEIVLEEVGVAGAFVGAEAGGEGVTETDDEGTWVDGRGGCEGRGPRGWARAFRCDGRARRFRPSARRL